MRIKPLYLALIAAGLLAQPALAQRSTLDNLGTLGGTTSYGLALNNNNQVAGYAVASSTYYDHAFLWSSGGGMQDLGTLGGTSSYAFALNYSGQVAGYSYTSSGAYHAFLWSSGGGMQDLGTLGGSFSYAYALNNSGQVAGYSRTSSSANHAFLWTSGGGMQDLGTLSGGGYSEARALNSSGQVAGAAGTSSGLNHAFLWSSGGGMQDLGTLGGSTSRATALNNSGQVAGYADTSSGYSHAFLWSSGGGMQDLGTLGGISSYGQALSNSGQVAGYSYTSSGLMHAFLWNAGTMHDLNSLAPAGWTYRQATAINDQAQIVGYGSDSGYSRAFRLTLHPDWLGGNGYWSSAANWNFAGMGSFGITPGAPHDVAIAPVASATVYGPSDATVNSLSISATGTNLATLNLNSGSVTAVNGTTLGNNAIVTGNGRLAGNLAINAGGRVLAGNNQSLQLAGNVANGGRIDAQSASGRASLEIGGTLTNSGASSMNLFNADVMVHGGVINGGQMSFAGLNTVSGTVTNGVGGQVSVSGSAGETIFWDPFTNSGTVKVTPGSTAVFFGPVYGSGLFHGGGTFHFAGDVFPGMSPGLMTLGGSIIFSGGTLTMELGGLTPGSGHDKLVFLSGSTVSLAGIGLNVEYWGGWTAAAGQTYDLFDWNGLSGSFSSVALPALASGLAWNTSALYTTGEISVAAVPEPETWALMLAGLGLLGFAARRRI